MKRLSCIAALLFPLPGCGDDESPYVAVLTSEHFRVHAYSGVVPPGNLLNTLEADFRDVRAYLKFPEGMIDYYLYPSVEIAGRHCAPGGANPPAAACAPGRSVHTFDAPDHHELIHAYMYGVATAPPPILQEGVAEGVRCGSKYVRPDVVAPWRTTVVARTGTPSVYQAGLALFVYLVRNFGVDRFVEYYGWARDSQNPDVFQADFESFWGISLDTTWVDMLRSRPTDGRIYAICPCTQPVTLPLDGGEIDILALDTRTIPLPDEDSGPYLFSSGYDANVANCAQDIFSFDLARQPMRQLGMTAARLLPERHYISVAVGSSLAARKGNFVAQTCAEATPIAVPLGYTGALDMLVARESGDLSPGDWYARFSFKDAPRTVVVRPTSNTPQTLRICSSCETAGETCAPVARDQGDVTLSVGAEMVLRATYGVHFEDINRPTVRQTTVTVDSP